MTVYIGTRARSRGGTGRADHHGAVLCADGTSSSRRTGTYRSYEVETLIDFFSSPMPPRRAVCGAAKVLYRAHAVSSCAGAYGRTECSGDHKVASPRESTLKRPRRRGVRSSRQLRQTPPPDLGCSPLIANMQKSYFAPLSIPILLIQMCAQPARGVRPENRPICGRSRS